jgi:glyoxylase-like metal-dependent hydrolase (beta-lactamase superfamily II)
MAGIHRERPGAADLAAATDTPAVALGDDVWMSPGVSNAYAVATDDGRVIANAGLVFKGPLRNKAFQEIAGPTRANIVTQGHADHWGVVNTLRDADTDVVMHRNYRYWRDDNETADGLPGAQDLVRLREVLRRHRRAPRTFDIELETNA